MTETMVERVAERIADADGSDLKWRSPDRYLKEKARY